MRYCPGCGAASCSTCGRRVQRRPGVNGSAGGWFWGVLLLIAVVFWPSIYVHGPDKVALEIIWYGFLGMVIVSVLIGVQVSKRGPLRPRPKTGVPLTPPPSRPWVPDLRESDVFEGKRE